MFVVPTSHLGNSYEKMTLKQAITKAGLLNGLVLCLDAGDIASVPSTTTTKWLDTSGLGHDFFRGTDATSQASDPTFVGTPGGLSENEYWSLTSDQFFTYDTTNATWMRNIAMAGATFSLFMAYERGGAASMYTHGILGTCGSFPANADPPSIDGWAFEIMEDATTATFKVSNYKQSSGLPTEPYSTGIGTFSTSLTLMQIVGFSLQETVERAHLVNVKATSSTINVTYTDPATSVADVAMQIGAAGNGSGAEGTRKVGFLAMWEGVYLTAGKLDSLHSLMKPRYP